MRISEETLDNFFISYPLNKLAPLERILFLDIETTGFAAKSSYLYLIGCAYYRGGNGIPYNGWRKTMSKRPSC